MTETCGAVILAAGKGTRMNQALPKPMLPLGGRRLIDFPIHEIDLFFKKENIKGDLTVVVGHEKEALINHLQNKRGVKINFAEQKEQKGTADALMCYFSECKNASKHKFTLVAHGDTPLIQKEDLEILYKTLKKKGDAAAATFRVDNPFSYGRIVRNSRNGFHIVEEADVDEKTKNITEVNAGLYIFRTEFLLHHLKKIDKKNNLSEFYLTDIFQNDRDVIPVCFGYSKNFSGVNTSFELHVVQEHLFRRKNKELIHAGVHFTSFRHAYIDCDVEIGEGSFLYPNVCIEGMSKIGKDVVIESGVIIRNSTIEEGVKILSYSVLEDTHVKKNTRIGPFAHLRPGTSLESNVKVGNFVEIKKSTLESNVKVSHLSYVGDAHIGENTNIGCGLVTCNYDGHDKHPTRIGKDSFVGSDCQIIAPVSIGDRCYIGSGSTINQDVPDDAFALARSRQVTRKGMARRFLKKKNS